MTASPSPSMQKPYSHRPRYRESSCRLRGRRRHDHESRDPKALQGEFKEGKTLLVPDRGTMRLEDLRELEGSGLHHPWGLKKLRKTKRRLKSGAGVRETWGIRYRFQSSMPERPRNHQTRKDLLLLGDPLKNAPNIPQHNLNTIKLIQPTIHTVQDPPHSLVQPLFNLPELHCWLIEEEWRQRCFSGRLPPDGLNYVYCFSLMRVSPPIWHYLKFTGASSPLYLQGERIAPRNQHKTFIEGYTCLKG